MEKMTFNSMQELDEWIARFRTKDEAMKNAGYASGRKQYSRFKKSFENKAQIKLPKKTLISREKSTIPSRKRKKTELLELDWKELEAYVVRLMMEQRTKYGAEEIELKRWINNVLGNQKQYRIAKDTFNYINGYLREQNIEVIR